jgi:hypothetical protein
MPLQMDKHSSLSSSDKEKKEGTATLLILYESPNHKMRMKKERKKLHSCSKPLCKQKTGNRHSDVSNETHSSLPSMEQIQQNVPHIPLHQRHAIDKFFERLHAIPRTPPTCLTCGALI